MEAMALRRGVAIPYILCKIR
jgi:hypothetical protein